METTSTRDRGRPRDVIGHIGHSGHLSGQIRFGHLEALSRVPAYATPPTSPPPKPDDAARSVAQPPLQIVICPLGRDCLGDGPSCLPVAERLGL